MTTANGTAADKPTIKRQLREAKARVEIARATIEARRLERTARLIESVPLDGWGSVVDPRESLATDPNRPLGSPYSNPADRQHGDNWPLWRDEQELARLRQQSRILCATNGYAKGLLKNLTNYIVGKGYRYKVTSKELSADADPNAPGRQTDEHLKQLVAQAQDWLDDWLKRNKWGQRERETFRRTWRDGEAFLRLFPMDDGYPLVRFIEPEQIVNPPGETYLAGWTYGIRHQMEPYEDVESPTEYRAIYQGNPANEELISAGEVVHVKIPDEDSTVKRGCPAFVYDTFDAFLRAAKLQRNLSEGSALQAAIAWIEQFPTATPAQVTDLAEAAKAYDRSDITTGRSTRIEKVQPGTVKRVEGSRQFVPTPYTQDVAGHVQVAQGDLRQAVTAFTAPEYMTGDASNADYSSTKEAGAPFVKNGETEQEYYIAAFLDVINRAMRLAVEADCLPAEILALVEIQAEAPAVLHKDKLQQAQADQILVAIQAKSPQTVSMEQGLDPEQEQLNLEEQRARLGAGAPLPGFGDPPAIK